MTTIPGRYTLFTRIPVHLDGDAVLTNALWAKDIELHLPGAPEFGLCCPVEPLPADTDTLVRVEGFPASRVTPLRLDQGYFSVLRNFFPNFRRVAKAVGEARVVHSSGAGWGFPLSFYILPLSLFRRFEWVMVIESSFWMRSGSGRTTLRQWYRHQVHRILLGACLRRASARIFTTDSYRRFFGISTERSLISPAVWIDEEAIITEADQAARLSRLPQGEIRLAFPARLVPEKGSDVLIEAVNRAEELLPAAGPTIAVDIIGEGPLAAACQAFAAAYEGRLHVTYRKPVAYGPEFFALLRNYHAVVLANSQHEQPRIVFDSFSQGVPVISSATDGVREIVLDEEDALLYQIGDAEGLAEQIVRFATDADLRAHLTDNAPTAARGRSHAAMHQTRFAFLARTIGPKLADGSPSIAASSRSPMPANRPRL